MHSSLRTADERELVERLLGVRARPWWRSRSSPARRRRDLRASRAHVSAPGDPRHRLAAAARDGSRADVVATDDAPSRFDGAGRAVQGGREPALRGGGRDLPPAALRSGGTARLGRPDRRVVAHFAAGARGGCGCSRSSTGVQELIAEHAPGAVALEESYVGADARIALSVGQARGAVLVAASSAGVACAEYAPAASSRPSAATAAPTRSRCSGW